MLHHEPHAVFGNGHAAAGIGLHRAKAVQEDGGSAAGCSFFIEADIQAILVLCSTMCSLSSSARSGTSRVRWRLPLEGLMMLLTVLTT